MIWTPTFDQAGSYQVTVTATDGHSADSATIDIDVTNTNRAPRLVPLARQFGIEITEPEFWRGSLELVAEQVKRYEELI